ncbi:ferric reductase-like transmembrane domain-containing protein [Amycolatopsis benzoatilytica]|uniref:ferric reductase-like transmembrane domain-containing protein n=1 Tax=Amycolatopsis benzoatilytica TaxID=346045 RepID=UPI0003621D3B|nr:ferric reductase-like transmembrane domain-containing protein [Amycolatopsis benzoatilytica]
MSSALWYFSRATGIVALVFFTAVVVLGFLNTSRLATRRWPRSALADLHRNLSLASLVFLAAHIVFAVVDGYVNLSWLAVLVPFVSGYQPFWVGLGAAAVDLLLAIVVTSLLRARIPLRVWRAVHWLAYLCWPVALVHGIGLVASDSARPLLVSLDIACVIAVLAAATVRFSSTHPDTEARRLSSLQR